MVSLLVAFTLVPTLAARVLRPHRSTGPETPATRRGLYARIEDAYEALLRVGLRHRLATVVATILLVAGTLYLARGLKPDFIVADDMSEFEVVVETPQGSSLAQSDAIARQYFPDSIARQAAGAVYLRDNIKYDFGPDERAAVELFYRYAAEAGVVGTPGPLRFFGE